MTSLLRRCAKRTRYRTRVRNRVYGGPKSLLRKCNDVYDLSGWGEIRTRERRLGRDTLSRRSTDSACTLKTCVQLRLTPHALSAPHPTVSIVWPERRNVHVAYTPLTSAPWHGVACRP